MTALHWAAYYGRTKVVKYLVHKCKAVITTQNKKGRTPISDVERQGRTKIAKYLKAHVMKRIMGIKFNMLPFYKGVRGIIAKYLL